MKFKEYKEKLDKALANENYEKFLVYFAQLFYGSSVKERETKNMIFYKSLALLYLLATDQQQMYFCYLQACNNHLAYQYVLDIYDFVNICDIESLKAIKEKSSGIFCKIISMNIENIERKLNTLTSKELDLKKDESACVHKYLDSIEECLLVINNSE